MFLGSTKILSGALAFRVTQCFPELDQAVYNAVQEIRWNDAISAQKALTELFNHCETALKAEFNQVNSDFACGPARKPQLNVYFNHLLYLITSTSLIIIKG